MARRNIDPKQENRVSAVSDRIDGRRAEEQLHLLSHAVQESPGVGIIADAAGTILFINRTVPGLTTQGVIGTSVYDYVPRKHHDTLRRLLERVFDTGTAHCYEIGGAAPFGPASWRISKIGPIMRDGRVVAATLFATDITERKLAEEALRESEDRFRAICEAVPIPMVISRMCDGKILYANERLGLTFGLPSQQSIGRKTPEFYEDPADRQVLLDLLKRDGYVSNYEVRAKKADGTPFWVVVSLQPMTFDGEPAMIAGFYDIIDRRRAEEALRESEERYRRLVELSPYGIAVHSEGKLVFVNRAAAELLGVAHPDQLIGRPLRDFVHPDYADAVMKRIQRTRSEGKKVDLVEEVLIRLDGHVIDVEMAAIPITYQGKPARQVVLRDISERKRMEAVLQRTREELESAVERQMQRANAYGLTFRELAVLHLVAAGRSDKGIGTTLGISPLTASKHLANILDKMGATSRTEAGVRAVKEGLVE